jgi:hypothetical protein
VVEVVTSEAKQTEPVEADLVGLFSKSLTFLS